MQKKEKKILCKQISSNFLKNNITYKLFTYKFYMSNQFIVFNQNTGVV